MRSTRRMLTSLLFAPLLLAAAAGGAAAAPPPPGGGGGAEALGRPPKQAELDGWVKLPGHDKAGIMKVLKTNLAYAAEFENEVRQVIERAYARGFGRKPRAEDADYWYAEIRGKKKELGFADIVNASREYLRRPENDSDRRQVIQSAYLNSMGRFPEAGDIDYWQKRMTSEGATFYDVSQAGGQYMLGSSPAQQQELRAAARRAFEMAKAPAPTEEQLQKVMNGYRSFAEKQTALQQGKPARLTFWLMVQDAGLMAHGKYPKPEDVPPAVSRF